MKPYGCKEKSRVMLSRYADWRTKEALLDGEIYIVEETDWDCSSEELAEFCPREDERLETGCGECNNAVWVIRIGDYWYEADNFVLADGIDPEAVVLLSNSELELRDILEDIMNRSHQRKIVDRLRQELEDRGKIKCGRFEEIVLRIVGEEYRPGTRNFDTIVAIIVEAFQDIGINDATLQPMMPW